jgi:hypothetical protein
MAIRRRTRDCLGREVARRAGPVLDNERLPEPLGQILAHQACQQVARSTGWKSGDNAHRLGRIGLRAGDIRPRQQRATARRELQESTTMKLHGAIRVRLATGFRPVENRTTIKVNPGSSKKSRLNQATTCRRRHDA